MIETAILATPLALAIHVTRNHRHQVMKVWREARWYEKLALALVCLPIPGPMDEIAGVLVIRRIIKRRNA